MNDRIKLAALIGIALIAFGALGVIVYNFVANDWRLTDNPLDLSGALGDEEQPEADERTATRTLHFGDSVRSIRLATQALRVRFDAAVTPGIDLHVALSGDATDSSRYRFSARAELGELRIESAPTSALGNATGTLEVLIPLGLHLALSTEGGDIIIQNISGRVEATSRAGSIELSGFAGSVHAAVEGGDLLLDGCRLDSASLRTDGVITLRLNEGPVDAIAREIQASRHFGALDARALGVIHAEILDDSSAVHLQSDEGNVYLRVLGGARFAYDVEAPNGSIVSNVPFDSLTAENATEHTLRATMNGGGIPATIRSARGNVEILLFEAGETSTTDKHVEDPSSPSGVALRDVQPVSGRARRTLEGSRCHDRRASRRGV